MERVLSRLFDFQKFQENPDLQREIDAVHDRYAVRELSLDEMEMLAAAGAPVLMKKPKQDDANRK